MRIKETVMVPTVVTTYTCDYCSKSVKDQICYGGHGTIMMCTKCKKDGCVEHIKCFNHSGTDYCDYHICTDCQPKMEHVWDIATFLFNEDDHYFPDLVDKIWDEYEDYKPLLDKIYKPLEREDIMDVPDVDI